MSTVVLSVWSPTQGSPGGHETGLGVGVGVIVGVGVGVGGGGPQDGYSS